MRTVRSSGRILGVSAPGGVCSRGCLLWGWGVSAPGGGCLQYSNIHTIIFWAAWQQMEVFTLNQFLSVYWAQWVTYSFTLKFCALVSIIQYNISNGLIFRNWQYKNVCRRIMYNQHHTCVLEADYYLSFYNVHFKLDLSTEWNKNVFQYAAYRPLQ